MHRALLRHHVFSFLVCFSFGLVATSTCFAHPQQPEWARYRTNNDQFSVALPTMPAMMTRTNWIDELKKWRQDRLIGAYVDGVVYTIYISQNVPAKTLEAFASATMEAGLGGWNLNSLQQLTVDRVHGRQYLMTRSGVEGTVQFYATSEHLYRFEAVGAGANDPRVSRFYRSISFSRNPAGTEVVDGLGVQWRLPKTDDTESNRTFNGKELDRKVIIVAKPEPQYTEIARQNRIAGRVVIKAVFSRDGVVESITVVSGQPDGLTENSIAATQQIKFLPAVRNGQFVSTWMQLEYNFDIY